MLIFDIGGILLPVYVFTANNLMRYSNVIEGGTTDLTVARIKDGHHEVDLTCGHADLGGMKMDSLLFEYVMSRISVG